MDRKSFFEHVRRSLFEGNLSQSQVSGMTAILDEWDRRKLTTKEWLAYMLATVFWECSRKMQPISEFGGPSKRYAPYYGRGFVQLTWKANYQKAGNKLGIDLVGHPDFALNLAFATQILFDGMIEGWFTGKKLSDFILDASHCDYVGARRIINGIDKAVTVAGFATSFETAIEAAEIGQPAPPDMPITARPPIETPAPKPKPSTPQGTAGKVGAGVIVAGGAAAATSNHPWLWIGVTVGLLIAGAIVFAFIQYRNRTK